MKTSIEIEYKPQSSVLIDSNEPFAVEVVTQSPISVELSLTNIGPKGDTGATGAIGPAGAGLATGGTTGQVLKKKTNSDYETEWVTVGSLADQNADNVNITGGTIGGQDVVGFGQAVVLSKLNLMGL